MAQCPALAQHIRLNGRLPFLPSLLVPFPFLSTSAVSLAHICPPVVFYHLVHLGVSLFLSRPPASCFVSCTIPPSLSPSACCQNPLHQSQTLSPQKHLRITSISLSPQELSTLLVFCLWLDPFSLIFQYIFLLVNGNLFHLYITSSFFSYVHILTYHHICIAVVFLIYSFTNKNPC